MIKSIIDILRVDDFYNQSRRIDIAKGLYQKPVTFGDCKNLLKRLWYGKYKNV